jgi:uncharacterized repeat protein (TIGR03803 family)
LLSAQTFTTVHTFIGPDGEYPNGPLIQATNGYAYGTTASGGANCGSNGGCGTVFKISPKGVFTTIYSFCSQSSCADGSYPEAGLIQATNEDLYGTTSGGGANQRTSGGAGTVFKITPNGILTTLYNFCSQPGCSDGSFPAAGLVQATNGDLYGIAGETVFKISPRGAYTALYTFCLQTGCLDGQIPTGLIQAANGDFYGTTQYGGAGVHPDGTIFKMTPAGVPTILHNFCSRTQCTDGNYASVLVQAPDGYVYGTTNGGGSQGAGTFYRMTPGGVFTKLYNFCYLTCPDGSDPEVGLAVASDGDLYGTTDYGGIVDPGANSGTIFKITPSGDLTTLYSFCEYNCRDGGRPSALLQATNGNFYGVTKDGGPEGLGNAPGVGTVFSLSVGLPPFVKTQTASGEVGAAVNILGSDLTGATSVSFNGVDTVFNVASRFVITTTVPAGATTGTVQVVTPSGTLLSNVPFRVP